MKVLLSGASGTVGIPLVAALLAHDADLRLTCVLRSEKARAALAQTLTPAQRERVDFIEADLSDDASVDMAARLLAMEHVPTVGVHLAADVSWDKSCEEMQQLNVQGTRNFVRLLLAASARAHMVYVSTAYTRTHDWDYRNGYEESKAMAERSLREEFGARLPISTFSCSLVVGDSRTGEIARFNGLYPLIKFLAAFNPPFLVGNKDGLLDIVPVDWVVAELHAMVLRCAASDTPGECVASAGPHRVRYETAVRLIEERIALARRRHGLAELAPVPILRDRQWGFLKRALAAWQPPGISRSDFRYFERLLRVYGTYASSDRVRPPLHVSSPSPDPLAFLPGVVDHWIACHPRTVRPQASTASSAPAAQEQPA
ncbi:nucleoside-diphosphate-sugar epimerase [Variovorax sp. SG517]|uniref:SDR family oxidoreductase n=1 Tax=Variovorax sp. SG517 TaxID=2587117 RepID=UPI00159EA506|nr:SDR family oxidoreductase [Variovorax sp. SG517]NVM93033.1 nucleoside-diphosphate-sugar epimerase [Variovorax sp. SG517]